VGGVGGRGAVERAGVGLHTHTEGHSTWVFHAPGEHLQGHYPAAVFFWQDKASGATGGVKLAAWPPWGPRGQQEVCSGSSSSCLRNCRAIYD